MAVYQRKEIRKFFREIEKDGIYPVYLLHGERYLCRRIGEQLIAVLSKKRGEEGQVEIKHIEGEKEDPLHIVNLLKSHSLFSGRQILRVTDSRLLSSGVNIRNFWDRAVKAYADNDQKGVTGGLRELLKLANLENCRELAELEAGQWRKFFGFAKPGNLEWLNDININRNKNNSLKEDKAKELISFLEEGSCRNILILISEEVDKRKKLYRTIDQQGMVIDLSVPAGENATARKEKDSIIRDLISGTIREMNKKAEPAVIEKLIERVGFHPVAAVLETEKLVLFCDDKEVIEASDVDLVVGRTKEEAIFELNEAVVELDLSRSLLLVDRLMNRGIHCLAIVATLRKMLRKILYIRFLQERYPAYTPGQTYSHFQKEYLNQLKNSRFSESPYLKGHPYALYKAFRQAEKLNTAFLRKGLKELLKTEYRLKGSGVRDKLVMDDFFFSFLTGQEKV